MGTRAYWLLIPLLVFSALLTGETNDGRKAYLRNQELADLSAAIADQDAISHLRLRQQTLSREKTARYPFLGERWIGSESSFSLLEATDNIPIEITDPGGTVITEYAVGDTIIITITYADSVRIKPFIDDGDGNFDPATDFFFAPDDPEEDPEDIIIIDGDEDDEDPAAGVWKITFNTGRGDEEDMLFILQGVKIYFSLSNMAGTDAGLASLDVLPLVSETSLSGNVSKHDESPAPNMVVIAFPMEETAMEGPPKNMFITLTGAAGDYTLFINDDAAGGDFAVFTFDFLKQHVGLFPDPLMLMQPVAIGDSLLNVDFTLVLPNATITGTLTDDSGSPIADVRIFAGLDGPLGVVDTTDADGQYTIHIIAGRWHVRPNEDDLIDLGYMAPFGKEGYDVVDEDVLVADFVVYAADATITGTVTLDGTPLAGQEIGAWGDPVGHTFAESEADGSYTLHVSTNVDARGYDIWPEDMPERTYFTEKLWEIQPGDTEININLVTADGGITGVVTDKTSGETIYEVGIEVRDETGMNYHTWIDWETGTYELYLPDGVYEIMAFSHEYFPYKYGPVPVTGSLVTHDIALEKIVFNAKIGGTLKDDAGAAIAGIRVFAGAEIHYGMDAVTDDAGQYVIPAFPGKWHVHVDGKDLLERGYLAPHGKDGFDVAEGDSIAMDFVTYVADATITGTVTWAADGSPVEDAEIHGGSPDYFTRARTDADGIYALPVSSKLDSVDITGGEGTWKHYGYWVNVWYQEALSQPGGYGEVFSKSTGIDFAMYPADAFLSGMVSDQTGKPIPHAELHAFTIEDTMEFHTGSQTEDNGMYMMPLIGGYKWVVEIFLPFAHDSTALSDTLEVASDTILVRNYILTVPTVSVAAAERSLPVKYTLGNNYPNPFNPSTTITYQLPEAGHVTLQVYDLTGKVVNTLVGEYRPAGYHQVVWNGRNSHGVPVATGVYFYRIVADQSYVETKKMILLK